MILTRYPDPSALVVQENVATDELPGRSMELVCLPEEQPALQQNCLAGQSLQFRGTRTSLHGLGQRPNFAPDHLA
jgi:hypothetical protein